MRKKHEKILTESFPTVVVEALILDCAIPDDIPALETGFE